MATHNQHLTTEQLSAFLDDVLSAQERVSYEAHLNTCQQCQQTLTELRQTVALLRALPQPALPRSFVLSPDMLAAKPAAPTLLPFPAARRNSKPSFAYSSLRFASGLAAVIGIVLLTASLFSALPHAMMSAATTSGGASSSTSAGSVAPEASTPASGTKNASSGDNGTATANNQHTTPVPLTPAIQGRTTPAPRVVAPHITGPTTTAAPLFTLPDLATPGGQALLGIILLVLGILGLLLLRWQRNRQARAPTYPQ